MNKRIKKEWIKALRSGEYKQGEAALFDDDKKTYCCLGVLYESCIDGYWERKPEGWVIPGSGRARLDEIIPGSGYLPTWLEKKVGLAQQTQQKLAEMNDSGAPFSEIADYIERWL